MRAPLFHTGALALLLAACAPDLRDDFPFDGERPSGPRVSHEELGDGSSLTHVDASDKGAWVYLDLDTRAELDTPTALTT
ncbi:MAG: hypothetical protein L0Y66_25775, partial [Myxococcaceae bacterium]|nr:hypothetical protein [Myxococcaceae bacterium]